MFKLSRRVKSKDSRPPAPPQFTIPPNFPPTLIERILIEHNADLPTQWLAVRRLNKQYKRAVEAHFKTEVLPHVSIALGRRTPVAMPFDALEETERRAGRRALFWCKAPPRPRHAHLALAAGPTLLDQTDDYAAQMRIWGEVLEKWTPVVVRIAGHEAAPGALGEGVDCEGRRFTRTGVKDAQGKEREHEEGFPVGEIMSDVGAHTVYRVRGMVEEPIRNTASISVDWRLLLSDVMGLQAIMRTAIEASKADSAIREIASTLTLQRQRQPPANEVANEVAKTQQDIKKITKTMAQSFEAFMDRMNNSLDPLQKRRLHRLFHNDCLVRLRETVPQGDERTYVEDLFSEYIRNPDPGAPKHKRWAAYLGPWQGPARRTVNTDSRMALGSWAPEPDESETKPDKIVGKRAGRKGGNKSRRGFQVAAA